MKKLFSVTLFFLFFLFSFHLIAQQKDTTNKPDQSIKPVPQVVSSYFNSLRSYKSKKDVKEDMDTISLGRMRNIAKRMFEVREKDAVAAAITLDAECVLADSLYTQKWRHNKDVQLIAKPSLIENYLYKKIIDILPHNVYPLIKADYLLKVKIKSIKAINHEYTNIVTGHKDPPMTSIEIEVIIEEIIKGDTRFSVGETITFYYMPPWRYDCSSDSHFKVGEICFVPLRARLEPLFNLNLIGLLTVLDSSCGRYPIVNGELIDNDNYFGFGKKVNWETFKTNLSQLIKTIKSW